MRKEIFLPLFSLLNNNFILTALLVGLIIFSLIQIPYLILFVILACFCAVSTRGILQVYFSFFKKQNFSPRIPTEEKFITVIVPSHNEPPDILKNTLQKLADQTYSNYEVIVIDNNTNDISMWEPIAVYCMSLGKKFKFYHVNNFTGFKAGAINYAKNKRDSRAQLIAVVDADYEVKREFLKESNKYFVDNSIGFIQFPQSYENVSEKNIGLNLEYQHFFLIYMNMANYFNCVSATGTLTVFNLHALEQIGYFNNEYITEDMEIGIRLIKAGYRNLYVPKIVGKGLMPYDLQSYKKQKSRWAMGNMQVLRNHFFDIVFDKNLTIQQKIGLLSQLTAWINFTFIPVLTIITASILKAINPESHYLMRFTASMAAITLLTFLILKFISFYKIFKLGNPISFVVRAFMVHIGLISIYSFSFIRLFINSPFIFQRTNKFILISMNTPGIKHALLELFLGLLSILLSIFHFVSENYIYAGVLSLVGIVYLSILYLNRELESTKEVSEEIFSFASPSLLIEGNNSIEM